MDAYDDRPISVYDNLNTPAAVHSGSPQAKLPTSSSTNGALHSPYAEIAFRFGDNNNQHQQTQQQYSLPNGNRGLNHNQSSQVHPNAVQYTTPYKPTNATAQQATPPIAAATHANRTPRPLSQHSQSELNEASQSIAAVKAALNDAKSKFFGINDYAPENPNESQRTHKLLNDNEPHKPSIQTHLAPKPPAKPTPKYQNIPENSAIFRSQPPQLPPKPVEAWKSPSPIREPAVDSSHVSRASPTHMAEPSLDSQGRTLPYPAYKQIPLNDIDGPQPSQAVYMSTTVPQNIKGSKIAGRHTPTRNSLRHSRMLVVNNKNFQPKQYPNPMSLKHPEFVRWLLILKLIIGILISVLAIWIFFLAPSTSIQDNPYWSGLVLILSGTLGLWLIRYQRIKRLKVRENCFLFLRANSYVLSLLAVLLCTAAHICASIHFARLTAGDTKCESANILLEHGSCTCTFNVPPTNAAANSTSTPEADGRLFQETNVDRSYKVEYRDLSCQEVTGEWIYILGLSIALNTLGLVAAVCYIISLACYRHSEKRIYTSVHTSTF